jgi:hypothetical protein
MGSSSASSPPATLLFEVLPHALPKFDSAFTKTTNQ